MTHRKIPYLKNSFKTRLAAVNEWRFFEGTQGCTLLDAHGLRLNMTKSPPPLVTETTTTKPEPTEMTKLPVQKVEEPLLVAAWKEMRGWGSKGSVDGTQKVDPFDLYDLPVGMRADGLTVSEAFVKRWLNGRAYSA